jgi:hypothetical protein
VKLAELTSGVGALVLGIGFGAYFYQAFTHSALALLVTGLVAHAWGMWDKHRLERRASVETVWWSTAPYWACWLAVLGMLVALLF